MIKYRRLQDVRWLTDEVQIKPLHQIAEELGCSYSAVLVATRRFNISIPIRKKRRVFPHKSINQKLAIKRKFPHGRFGKLHPNWKGGKNIVNGYYMVFNLNHPRSGKKNRVFEHILVAEKKIGRYLEKDEVVHHINGNKLDNSPENLLVMKRSEHVGYHLSSGNNIQDLVERIKYLEQILTDNKITY